MCYGLTPKATRRLAYEFAEKNTVNIPESWKENKMAGKDWFTGFMTRKSDFQNKLETVSKNLQFTASDIYNLNEAGVTTVQKTQKIIAIKGQPQIGQVTSREMEELITPVRIIRTNGTALPPVWVFPRIKYDPHGVLSEYGALGLVHKLGWMTSDDFGKVLEHFVTHVRCSNEHKVIFIMDNCKENGIIIITLPSHISNKLQPLHSAVFGTFKKFFNQGVDGWMISHPGRTLTIYDLPEIYIKAWDKAATPINIRSGFRCTGIWPFDKNIFTKEDFMCSYVTGRTRTPYKETVTSIPVEPPKPDIKLEEEDEETTDLKQLDVGNFVIYKVYGKKITTYYAAKIEERKKNTT
ncbi:hypothetical protein ILUMI_19129 [Ignelater luminosus]|uniref:DDE-1 domain-containing protein n=1 Tax=Ignelater luminosus TaxID=2038154 RepID=A0A8K0CIP6_IGNLU|nr:hypothetical protein ILUMI_19129 [Ignelater luminosus]